MKRKTTDSKIVALQDKKERNKRKNNIIVKGVQIAGEREKEEVEQFLTKSLQVKTIILNAYKVYKE